MGLPSLPRPRLMSASLALAPPAPTSPARGTHCSSARTLGSRRGGCKLAGTHGAQGAEGLGGGDARGRRQPACSRPPFLARAEVGGTRRPSPAEPGRAGRRRLPFSPPASFGAPRGLALKRSGSLVYRLRREADRAFVWKVSISSPGCNVFLVNSHWADRPEKGGLQVHVWFQRRIERVTFVHSL